MIDPENPLAQRLWSAADAITGGDEPAPDSAALLRFLGYDDNHADAAPARARLLRAAATFRRLFRLPMQDAPGLTFFGAEADPATLGPGNAGLPVGGFAGSGLHPAQAFESCVGEGIEYLSQFAQAQDAVRSATFDAVRDSLDADSYRFTEAVLAAAGIPPDRPLDWIETHRITGGGTGWYPADLCLRRPSPDFVAPLKLSTGCAAGVTKAAATLRALLELIERDAVALWWRGGRPGRAVARDGAEALLGRIRPRVPTRRTVLLDITTDLGVPVVVAFSTSNDGDGFALGVAARPTQAEAVRSAIYELCQSELSLRVIAAKQRQSGEAALNDSDRHQLARARLLDPETRALLRPIDAPPPTAYEPGADPLDAIVNHLKAHQIVIYQQDLTRPQFGVPVIRIIAPALQQDPCGIVTERLCRAIAETGGGARHHGGTALL